MSMAISRKFWGNIVMVVIAIFIVRGQDLAPRKNFVKHHPKESNSARQGLESRLRPARVACEQFYIMLRMVDHLTPATSLTALRMRPFSALVTGSKPLAAARTFS